MNHTRWRNTENLIFIFAFIFINAVSVFAGPSRTTYQAKIVRPDGHPLEATSTQFKFTILDPSATCILYAETYSNVNMANTGGLISFTLGAGVKTYPLVATTFEQIFSNITPNMACDTGGGAPAVYTPFANDSRKIVMQFNDGSGWQTLPAMAINAVPYAMYANDSQKLNGMESSDFVQISSVTTCGVSEALSFNGASFSCIAAGGTGTITSGSVITALGYTPADGASVTALSSSLSTTDSNVSAVSSSVSSLNFNLAAVSSSVGLLNSQLAAVSSSVFAVSATVSSLSSTVSNLATAVSGISTTVSGLSASMAALVSSQWSSNGDKIYYNSGFIGIGTSNPVSTMEVVSTTASAFINIQGAESQGSGVRFFSKRGTASETIGSSNPSADNKGWSFGTINDQSAATTRRNNLEASHWNGTAWTTAMVMTASGNIGVGTLTPSRRFEVFSPATNRNVMGLRTSDYVLSTSGTTMTFQFGAPSGNTYSSINSLSDGGLVGSHLVLQEIGNGLVGIGTSTPVTRLDVSGGVRIGTEAASCSAALAGTLRYNGGAVEYCNGLSWAAFGVSGAGLTLLNGSASNTQSFANGFTGNTPGFNTVGGVHTLNIPLASAGSVTAGLISNADYVNFTNKITSSAASIAQVLGYVPASATALGSYVLRANNLSDLTSSATARANLGLGGFATISSLDLGSASATGTLASARLPAFNGDVTSTSGSATLTLANSGVTSGTYTKVSVNTKGLVTSGAQLNSSDVTTALGYTPASASASTQWTTSGTTIFYNTGNIGIGTASPLSNLHVYNDVNAEAAIIVENPSASASAYASLVVKSNGNGINVESYGTGATGTWGAVPKADSAVLRTHVASPAANMLVGTATAVPLHLMTGSTPRLSIDGTGNISVGAVSATARLQIAAGSTSLAPLKFTSGTLLSTPASGAVEYDGNYYYITDGANVRRAIATVATPGTFDGAGTISNSGNIVMYPNNGTGSVIVSATTASTNSQTGALQVKGGLGVAGNIFASGTIITSSNMQAASITATSGMISPYLYGSIASGGDLTIDSTTHATKGDILLAPNGGSLIGIGKSTPGFTVDVSGSVNVSSNIPNVTVISSTAMSINLRVNNGDSDFGGIGMTQESANNGDTTIFYGDDVGDDLRFTNVRSVSPNYNLTENMRLTSDGRLGLGTNTPAYKMEIYEAASPTLRIRSASNDPSSGPVIRLTEDLSENGGFIRYHSLQNTMDIGVLETTEKKAISIDRPTANVNIGGGTPSAAAKLAIEGSGAVGVQIKTTGAGAVDTMNLINNMDALGEFWFAKGSSASAAPSTANRLINITNEGNFEFYGQAVNAGNDKSGIIAIKTQASADGGTRKEGSLEFYTRNANLDDLTGYVGFETNSDNMSMMSSYGSLIFGASSAEQMRLTTTGLGIGTTTPAASLQVSGGAIMPSWGNAVSGGIYFPPNPGGGSADEAYIRYYAVSGENTKFMIGTGNDALDTIGFTQNGAERMTISNGNIGIGTSAPSILLDVANTTGTTGNLTTANFFAPNLASGTNMNQIRVGVAASTNNSAELRFTYAGGAASATNYGSLALHNQSTPSIAWNGLGNVAIGHTAPETELHVQKNQNSDTSVVVKNTSSGTAAMTAVSIESDANGIQMVSYGSAHAGTWGGSSIPKADSAMIRTYTTAPVVNMGIGTGNAAPVHIVTSDIPRLTVASTGEVGVGTTNPQGAFQVIGSNNGSTVSQSVSLGLSGNYASIELKGASAATGGGFIDFGYPSNDFAGRILYDNSGDAMSFYTNGTEQVRLISTGFLGVGTSAPTQRLHVLGNLRVQGSTDCTLGNGSGGTSCSSDIRLKENIKPIPYALDKVLSLRGVEFDWNAKAGSPGRHDIGVIAQDVEKAFPTAVITDEATGYKKVDYAVLVAPLIQAVKDIHARIVKLFERTETHSREIASIKEENAELKSRVEKSEQENAELKARLERIEKALSNSSKK